MVKGFESWTCNSNGRRFIFSHNSFPSVKNMIYVALVQNVIENIKAGK